MQFDIVYRCRGGPTGDDKTLTDKAYFNLCHPPPIIPPRPPRTTTPTTTTPEPVCLPLCTGGTVCILFDGRAVCSCKQGSEWIPGQGCLNITTTITPPPPTTTLPTTPTTSDTPTTSQSDTPTTTPPVTPTTPPPVTPTTTPNDVTLEIITTTMMQMVFNTGPNGGCCPQSSNCAGLNWPPC